MSPDRAWPLGTWPRAHGAAEQSSHHPQKANTQNQPQNSGRTVNSTPEAPGAWMARSQRPALGPGAPRRAAMAGPAARGISVPSTSARPRRRLPLHPSGTWLARAGCASPNPPAAEGDGARGLGQGSREPGHRAWHCKTESSALTPRHTPTRGPPAARGHLYSLGRHVQPGAVETCQPGYWR